jgi:signal peptidase I
MYVSQIMLNKITVIAAEEQLDKNCIINIKIVSDSMEPFIKTGKQLAFRSKISCKKPKFGDVILCKQKYGGSLMVHRFYFRFKKNGEYFYLTKADKSLIFDYPSTEKQYMGVYIKQDKGTFLNTFIIFFSIFCFPFFILKTKIKFKDWVISN